MNRSETTKALNAIRWKDQPALLAEAIANKVCARCNGAIGFKKKPTWQQLRKRKFCYACQSIELSESRKASRLSESSNGRGYRNTYIGDRKLRVHQARAEEVLGRRLREGEVVHHINGNTSDNRNCNLLVCMADYHSDLHWRMRRQYKEDHPEYDGPIINADKLFMQEHFADN